VASGKETMLSPEQKLELFDHIGKLSLLLSPSHRAINGTNHETLIDSTKCNNPDYFVQLLVHEDLL